MSNGPSLPDHPLLRRVAELLESHGYAGEVYDAEWRIVFMSSNYVATTDPEGGAPERFYGQSVIARTLGEERAIMSLPLGRPTACSHALGTVSMELGRPLHL